MKTKSLLFFNLYWLFGILYFCFGRYAWHVPSYFILLFYIFLNFLAVNLGYRSVPTSQIAEKEVAPARNVLSEKEQFDRIKVFFAIACVITMYFQIIWVTTFLGKFSITTAFQNIGENYYDRMEFESDGTVFVMQFRTLFWFITYFVFPIGFMFFKVMNRFCKVLFVATVFVEVFASLNMGVSKNIGDLVFIYLATFFLRSAHNRRTSRVSSFRNTPSPKKKNKVFLRVVILVIVLLIAFSVIQASRNAVTENFDRNVFYKFCDIRSFSLFDVFFFWNESLLEVLDNLGKYVSHAYCGLAYALELPFENTYGLGFSRSLMEYATQYFGIPYMNEHTYNARIDMLYGWKDGQWWPTAFIWYGNAVSLWLVPLVMFFFGRFFKNVENRWFRSNQILSLVMYCQLFISFVYLSCNAQIFQGRHILIATFVLFFLYFCVNVLKIKIKW